MRKLVIIVVFATASVFGAIDHPWTGKKVVFLGDSITDPNQIERRGRHLYWQFLADDCGIEPHVYAVSGYQWSNIYPMARKMRGEMTNSVDAIMIFLGTNDYNAGVPLGEWFEVEEKDVNRNGVTLRLPHRTFVRGMGTFRGRINTVLGYLKQEFPDQQIVLMTPIHRGYANFGSSNVQPPENVPNVLGLYVEDYIRVLREAADIWSVPLIDLYRESGLLPCDPAYAKDFADGGADGKDNLHPSTSGHRRLAKVIAGHLRTLPPDFK